jgi:hypothetical protein
MLTPAAKLAFITKTFDGFLRPKTNLIVKGSYAEQFYKNFKYIPVHQLYTNDQTQILFSLKIEKWMTNLSETLHGGAISTIIDASTTVNILMNDNKKRSNTSIGKFSSFCKKKL